MIVDTILFALGGNDVQKALSLASGKNYYYI